MNPQRVEQLGCLDLGDGSLGQRPKDVRFKASKHGVRMVRCPPGVPLACEDLERVLWCRQ